MVESVPSGALLGHYGFTFATVGYYLRNQILTCSGSRVSSTTRANCVSQRVHVSLVARGDRERGQHLLGSYFLRKKRRSIQRWMRRAGG